MIFTYFYTLISIPASFYFALAMTCFYTYDYFFRNGKNFKFEDSYYCLILLTCLLLAHQFEYEKLDLKNQAEILNCKIKIMELKKYE